MPACGTPVCPDMSQRNHIAMFMLPRLWVVSPAWLYCALSAPRRRKLRRYERHDRSGIRGHHAFTGLRNRPLGHQHWRTGCTDHPVGRRANDFRNGRFALARQHHDQIGADLMGLSDHVQGRRPGLNANIDPGTVDFLSSNGGHDVRIQLVDATHLRLRMQKECCR